MCLGGDRAFEHPSLPSSKMLTMNQVSILFSKSPCGVADDDNNNLSSLGCGALALKMLAASRTPRLAHRVGVPKRCLFGTPVAADTQRLLREDQDAAKIRMSRRWGWDVTKDKPSSASAWDWETVKNRRHPYHPAHQLSKRVDTPILSSMTSVPSLVSPLPDTPRPAKGFSPGSESSSGTSTLSGSLGSPCSPESRSSSPTSGSPLSWSLESLDSCCDSDSDSSVDSALTTSSASSSPREVPASPVQTRLTDFWRVRRCSISDMGGKSLPSTLPTARTSTRTCSV